jgi:hypothetical protein
MPHTFRLGDRVNLVRSVYNSGRGTYRVTALMPERDGEPQYRIKSEGPGPERVVVQTDLQVFRSGVFDS